MSPRAMLKRLIVTAACIGLLPWPWADAIIRCLHLGAA